MSNMKLLISFVQYDWQGGVGAAKNVIMKVRELRFRNSFSEALVTSFRYLVGEMCIVCQANSTKDMEESASKGWGGEVLHGKL